MTEEPTKPIATDGKPRRSSKPRDNAVTTNSRMRSHSGGETIVPQERMMIEEPGLLLRITATEIDAYARSMTMIKTRVTKPTVSKNQSFGGGSVVS